MAEKILVPLDGTEYAEQVVPFIGEVAKAGGFELVLLSVVDPGDLAVTEPPGEDVSAAHDVRTGSDTGMNMSAYGTSKGMNMTSHGTATASGMVWAPPVASAADLSPGDAEVLDAARRMEIKYLSGVEQKLEKMGVRSDTRLGFGNADHQVVEEAIMSGATMIAMSGRSERFWERGVLGSTTDRVLHASPMPVIVFKPMEGLAEAVSAKPETVVIAVDGSTESEDGVEPAVKLARELGAQVALIHVLRRDGGRRREHAENYLKELKSRIGGEVVTGVASGKSDDEVILFADQFDHPMIAVTEHGGISIGRWLRGSTTDKIIRNAGYPVLVIPSNRGA